MKKAKINLMKPFVVIILLTGTYISFGQGKDEIEKLEIRKSELNAQLQEIKKELKKIDERIDLIINENLDRNENILAVSKITIDATLRNEPMPTKDFIKKIKKGQEVEVLEIVNDYYKIKHKGQIGYINNLYLYDPLLVNIAKKMEKQEAEREKEQAKIRKKKSEEAKAQKYQKWMEKYGEINADCIVAGVIRIGWTEEMVKLSIGYPDKNNRSKGTWGTHEQWIYNKGKYKYVYFENGKLTSWQD